jgi:hypothetical protein
MLGWIKYLRRVRVETDALKQNRDFASTRTPSPSFGTRGSQVQILPLRPAFFTTDLLMGNDMGDETATLAIHMCTSAGWR